MTIFTKIINREIPANILYEDDKIIAFYDINPKQPGHFLVVPKREAANLLENTDEEIAYAFVKAKELAKEEMLRQEASSFKIVVNTGASAGQVVFHTHIHVIPYK
ncbi:histidine triad protein HinT [Mycoplasma buteonis]|uniref:histidine triad protein HinT n=1 Tax=Mycoplasma buteonis TaxID=171280 RepID=UPI00055E9FAF|nr:HIT family protein [Mycoplasma buteonis]